MSIKKPDLFLIGAPRCGTSSLFRWLTDHPDVNGTHPKETFFLMDPDHPLLNRDANLIQHGWKSFDRFAESRAQAKWLLEATTHHIYQETALQAICELDDHVRLLVVLREPSSRLRSSFNYTKHNLGNLPIGYSFKEYANDAIAGKYGNEVRQSQSSFVLQNDLRHGRYHDYLKKWKSVFGSRLYPVIFEQMQVNPRQELEKICRFLELPAKFYTGYSFNVRNASRVPISPGYQKFAKKLYRRTPKILRPAWIADLYRRIGTRRISSNGADKATMTELNEYYRDSNSALAKLLDLDLQLWETMTDAS